MAYKVTSNLSKLIEDKLKDIFMKDMQGEESEDGKIGKINKAKGGECT